MLPAARRGDSFDCASHGGGKIQSPCCKTVVIASAPAARVGDLGPCGGSGAPDVIQIGNPTVKIGGEPAAGKGHSMAHGGALKTGCSKVFIGQPIVDPHGNLVAVPAECAFVWSKRAPWPNNLGRFRSPAQIASGGQRGAWYKALTPWGEPRFIQSQVYIATIRGRQITVYLPTNWPHIPDFPQGEVMQGIVAALTSLSDEQLDAVKEVYFNPVVNPDDDYWRQKYNDPFHVSPAATGAGQMYIFATGNYADQPFWDHAIQHEAAHALWYARPDIHAKWNDAIAKDRRGVSHYGDNAPTEDFAEAVLMYSLVKGTPCEAAMAAAFPARFAILEDIFRSGYPKPGKGKKP